MRPKLSIRRTWAKRTSNLSFIRSLRRVPKRRRRKVVRSCNTGATPSSSCMKSLILGHLHLIRQESVGYQRNRCRRPKLSLRTLGRRWKRCSSIRSSFKRCNLLTARRVSGTFPFHKTARITLATTMMAEIRISIAPWSRDWLGICRPWSSSSFIQGEWSFFWSSITLGSKNTLTTWHRARDTTLWMKRS